MLRHTRIHLKHLKILTSPIPAEESYSRVIPAKAGIHLKYPFVALCVSRYSLPPSLIHTRMGGILFPQRSRHSRESGNPS